MSDVVIAALITATATLGAAIISIFVAIINNGGGKKDSSNHAVSESSSSSQEKSLRIKPRVFIVILLVLLIAGFAIWKFVISPNPNSNSNPNPDSVVATIKDYNEDVTKNNATCLNSDINISEGGRAVFVDDYVYYQNPKDGCKLYRMDKSFGNQELVSDVIVYWLNYYKGWLYFAGSDSGDQSSQYLYRMDKEGGSLQQLTSYHIHEPKIANGYIYYVILEGVNNKGLYRCKIDDSIDVYDTKTFEINGMCITENKVAFVVISGNNVYYENIDKDYHCYKISIGEGAKPEIKEELFIDERMGELALQGNTLYYSLGKDNDKDNDRKYGIYSKDLSSGTTTNISSLKATSMNVSNQYIYFCKYNDEHKLYRIDLNNTTAGAEKILDETVDNINVIGNLISYNSNGNSYWLLSDVDNFTPIKFNTSPSTLSTNK